MYSTDFDPSQWVYVNDSMGRLGQGHYKKRDNPNQTMTLDEFEKRRNSIETSKQKTKEQNINNSSNTQQKATLSPWDNPMIGEQKVTAPQPNRSSKIPIAQASAEQTKAPAPDPEKIVEQEEVIFNQNKEGGGGQSESGSVICTELVRQKKMSDSDARASTFYAHTHLPPSFMRGYRFWAVPYVRLMRKYKFATYLIVPFVHHRTKEILFRLNKKEKGSSYGKIICNIHDSLCIALGQIVDLKDHRKLYD